MQKYYAHALALLTLFLPGYFVAHAQSTYPNPTAAGLNVSSIPCLLLALVDLVFLIGVPIVVMSIIYSGFIFVTAGDNESKSTKARFVFTWTMIGALVLFGAKAIALAIETTVLDLGGPGAPGALTC